MNMGARIKELLEQRGLRQVDLLEKIPELDAKALSAAITRDSRFSEFALQIATALDVSLEFLLFGAAPRQQQSNDREQPKNDLNSQDVCELLALYGSCDREGRVFVVNALRSRIAALEAAALNKRKS